MIDRDYLRRARIDGARRRVMQDAVEVVEADLAALKHRGEQMAAEQAKLDADLAGAIDDARPLMSMDEIASRAGTTRTTLYRCQRRRRDQSAK
jgi:AcrR family transcriptional regulator